MCALFIVSNYLCLYDVLFLQLAVWLLTQHVDKHELNGTEWISYHCDTHADQRRGQVPILTQIYRQCVRSVNGRSALIALHLKQLKSETLRNYSPSYCVHRTADVPTVSVTPHAYWSIRISIAKWTVIDIGVNQEELNLAGCYAVSTGHPSGQSSYTICFANTEFISDVSEMAWSRGQEWRSWATWRHAVLIAMMILKRRVLFRHSHAWSPETTACRL
jgi:hypothetical protein